MSLARWISLSFKRCQGNLLNVRTTPPCMLLSETLATSIVVLVSGSIEFMPRQPSMHLHPTYIARQSVCCRIDFYSTWFASINCAGRPTDRPNRAWARRAVIIVPLWSHRCDGRTDGRTVGQATDSTGRTSESGRAGPAANFIRQKNFYRSADF